VRGSVVKRGNGYSVVIELDRDPITDKRRQKWHSGYRTKRAAERALTELQTAKDSGTYVPRSRQTVGEYVEEWLAAIAPTVRPSTQYSYGRNLRLHVVPRFGSAPLAAVDAGTLNQLYAALLAEGRQDHAGGGLSPRTVRYIHTILHRALKDAVREAGPESCGRCRPAQGGGGQPRRVDHLDRGAAAQLPRRQSRQSALDCLPAAGNDGIAAR
jgi:Phage integrase, N-terminal SAM-like domain/Arm DNA-binding domain